MPPRGSRFVFQHGRQSELGRVTEAGLIMDSTGPARMRSLGRYALVYTLAGRCRYRDLRGQAFEMTPGDLLLVFPDVPHIYGPPSGARWSEYYMIFEGPAFDLWRARGLLDPRRPLWHCEPVPTWLRRFESIPENPRAPGRVHPLVEVCRLQEALAEVMDWRPAGGPDDAEARALAEAAALLEADLARTLSLPALARRFGMSYQTFRKKFAAVQGSPPARYRVARMIDRACALMRRGDMRDKTIARELGFSDEFHFSRRFRAITGSTPTAYRKQLSRAR